MNSYHMHPTGCSCTICAPFKSKATDRIERGDFLTKPAVIPALELPSLEQQVAEMHKKLDDAIELLTDLVEKVANLTLDNDGFTVGEY